MKNMSDCTSMMDRAKMKAAEVASKYLIKQGEQAVKFSPFVIVSEVEVPQELLTDEVEK